MRRIGVFLALVALSLFLASPVGTAHVKPNEKVTLVDSSGSVGGFVNIQQNSNHDLRLVVSLKRVEPGVTYTVWIVNCAIGPGTHPCTVGPLTFRHPFGAASPFFCPVSIGGGPLTTITTNEAGNGNSGAIRINLADLPPGTYFNHIDVAPSPCHPSGLLPAGVFTTATGFSFTT